MALFITIIGFGIMIFLHELGHFLLAKRFGVLVHEFSIGMGPQLFSFGKGETKYSLRLFPIGGYVKLEGENEVEENSNPRSFSNIAPIKRIAILFAGAMMNFALGIIIFTIINTYSGIVPTIVDSIPEEYAAVNHPLKKGDEIIKLDNSRVHTIDDVTLFMSRCDGDISLTYRRDGKTEKIENFKAFNTENGYKLGVVFKGQRGSLFQNMQFAFYDATYVIKSVFYALSDLFTGKAGINTLSGPVEVVSVVGTITSQQSRYTFISILYLFAIITVNLGVFNLLPFPALDGGSIVFALYELITKKKVKSEIIGYLSLAGFALLMALAVVVTAGDIIDLIK